MIFILLTTIIVYPLVSYFLQRYLRQHPPNASSEFVYVAERFGQAAARLTLPLWLLLLTYLVWASGTAMPTSWVFLFLLLVPLLAVSSWLWWLEIRPSIVVTMTLVVLLLLLLLSGLASGLWSTIDLTVLPLSFFVLAPTIFMLYLLSRWAVEFIPLDATEQTDHRTEAVQLVASLFTTFPKASALVERGETKTSIKGNPFLGTGPGLLITEPENAVALRDGSSVKRFVGPGTVFIGLADVPFATLDLRSQFRVTRIETPTKDGIPVRLPCSSIFQVDPGPGTLQLNHPWPYSSKAAYLTLLAGAEVNPANNEDKYQATPWKELPLRTATYKLRQVVAQYTLDELFATIKQAPDKLPRHVVTGEMRPYVDQEMSQRGIRVTGGSVGAKVAPVDQRVVDQRIDNWKAHWSHILTLNQGRIDAEYLTQLRRVRSKVLGRMLSQMLQQSQLLTDDEQTAHSLVAIYLLKSLEDIARSPGLEQLLPEATYYARKTRQAMGED